MVKSWNCGGKRRTPECTRPRLSVEGRLCSKRSLPGHVARRCPNEGKASKNTGPKVLTEKCRVTKFSGSIFGANGEHEPEVDVNGFQNVKKGNGLMRHAHTVGDHLVGKFPPTIVENAPGSLSEPEPVQPPTCRSSLPKHRKHGEELSPPSGGHQPGRQAYGRSIP